MRAAYSRRRLRISTVSPQHGPILRLNRRQMESAISYLNPVDLIATHGSTLGSLLQRLYEFSSLDAAFWQNLHPEARSKTTFQNLVERPQKEGQIQPNMADIGPYGRRTAPLPFCWQSVEDIREARDQLVCDKFPRLTKCISK